MIPLRSPIRLLAALAMAAGLSACGAAPRDSGTSAGMPAALNVTARDLVEVDGAVTASAVTLFDIDHPRNEVSGP